MPDDIGMVGALETHISQLFFTPDRVLKLLRPVDTGFVSFVDRQARVDAARREFELNRRTAPDVYLGTADVVEHGEVADRMIVMRRLPADRQLDRLARHPDAGTALVDHLVEAARTIAAFHSRLEPITGDAAWMATGASLRRNWEDNLEVLAPVADALVPLEDHQLVGQLVDAYLRGRETLFEERITDGRVRDGHGDLRAEHVFFLDDGPRLIDCLAFRDDYRIGDVLNDVAFLAMDVQRLLGPQASQALVRAYDEFTDEHHPATLAHHYVAYRAHVRAKVAAIRHRQGDGSAADDVRRYHRLALEHLDVGRVRLVLVGGGAGVGKSTVAEGVADGLGAVWLRSDEIRKAMAGLDAGTHAFAAPGEGIYRPEVSERVYAELLRQAGELLQRGESVVLDATWGTEDLRGRARRLAEDLGATPTELHCVVPLAVAEERIARRLASIHEPSDATPEIARYLAERFEPWPSARAVDTGHPIPDCIAEACRHVLHPSAAAIDRTLRNGAVTVDQAVLLTNQSIRFYLSRTSALSAESLRSGPLTLPWEVVGTEPVTDEPFE